MAVSGGYGLLIEYARFTQSVKFERSAIDLPVSVSFSALPLGQMNSSTFRSALRTSRNMAAVTSLVPGPLVLNGSDEFEPVKNLGAVFACVLVRGNMFLLSFEYSTRPVPICFRLLAHLTRL